MLNGLRIGVGFELEENNVKDAHLRLDGFNHNDMTCGIWSTALFAVVQRFRSVEGWLELLPLQP